VICLLLFVGIFASQLFGQIRHAFANIGQYEIVITDNLHHLCEVMEYHFNINANEMYNHICKTTREAVADLGTDVVIKIMGTSASTIKLFAEIFIFLFTTILASFYMIVSRDKIREKKKESMFYKEITGILGNVYKVSVTYIKTQLIIMLFTTIVCYVGFLIIKNPYALVLALLVGIMDALPMLGVGIVLIPWGILLLLLKSYRDAIVLLILFVICYGFRELVEPKLVGKGIGISPLMTIVSMYVGLKVFGITGVVLGPIAYVVLKTLLEQL
jgi:sporulation integral membrane protein YtvI